MPRDTPSLRLKCSPTVQRFHKGPERGTCVEHAALGVSRQVRREGLVGQGGFEPPTSSFLGEALYLLSYRPTQTWTGCDNNGIGSCAFFPATHSHIPAQNARGSCLDDTVTPPTNFLYEISVPTHSVLCLAPRIFGAPYLAVPKGTALSSKLLRTF